MNQANIQAPSFVVLIRPHHFKPNPDTSKDNRFQSSAPIKELEDIRLKAHAEVTVVANTLEKHGIGTHMFEDEGKNTPDSVFPNNWFSTHAGGNIAVYPMCATNRRWERRSDILHLLKKKYRVQKITDYSGFELDQIYLEGTGAMVLDHADRVAYTCKSNRSNQRLLERFCSDFQYEPCYFSATDSYGIEVYHTNVLMSICTRFVLIGSSLIRNENCRAKIIKRIESSGRKVIELSERQILLFAGNAIELTGENEQFLALSTTAMASLTDEQITTIKQSAKLLPLDVRTIEMAGGSVRCMMAGIHLSPREQK